MRRNFGSLDLAALDLHDAAVDGLERQFSALDPCALDSDSADGSTSGDEFGRCVGLPLERVPLAAEAARAGRSAAATLTRPVAIGQQSPAGHEARESARRKRSISARGLDDDGDVRISNKLVATSEWPRQMHDQHHVELSALRCLSLKVMLSSLSTATSPASEDSPSPLSPSGFAAGVARRDKAAAVRPLRRPAIPCNMIQSV